MEVSDASQVLAAMITPALLISAGGTLVLSTSHRLSRVVDRVRVLARDAEQLSSPNREALTDPVYSYAKRSLITSQLTALAQRALILRSALAAFYTAIGFLVGTSIAIGVLTSLKFLADGFVIVLAMAGASALLWGSVLLVREGRLAIASTLDEMQYIRGLVGETRSPRRVSTHVGEVPNAELPILPGSPSPSPAQRGRGEPGTDLGHEALVTGVPADSRRDGSVVEKL